MSTNKHVLFNNKVNVKIVERIHTPKNFYQRKSDNNIKQNLENEQLENELSENEQKSKEKRNKNSIINNSWIGGSRRTRIQRNHRKRKTIRKRKH